MPDKSKGIIALLAQKFYMEPDEFVRTIKATCGLTKATNEEFLAFLIVAHEHDLNPLAHEIYAFPKQGGGIQVVASIDGWLKIANRHPMHDGIEVKEHFGTGGDLIAVTCRIWRKDRKVPIVATEYFKENKRDTGPWKTMPSRMLTHRAKAQAIRTAYGLSGIMDQDEYEAFMERQSASKPAIETPLTAIADSIPDLPDAEPAPEEPKVEPKPDPFIEPDQQAVVESVIINGGWPMKAIPEVLLVHAGVRDSAEIRESQLMNVMKAITEAAETKRAAKAKEGDKGRDA